MTPGRLWWLMQRDWQRGWAATFHDYFSSREILRWENRAGANLPPEAVPVHLLTGANDWLLACWMLASWFHFTGKNWRVVLHDDGTLPDGAREGIRRLFPDADFIESHDANREIDAALAGYPHCQKYRRAHPLARKIFDVPHFAENARFLILDSDVLFFQKPARILQWCGSTGDVNGAGDECWFNEDAADVSLISENEAREKFGIALWPRVNSGLCLLSKNTLDLDLCERALRETDITQGHVWLIEQTLFALCASARNRGGLLPPEYEVSLGAKARSGAVARHYVGAVRQRFYGEGIARLRPVLLGK